MGQLLVDSQKLPFPVKCPLKSLSGSPGFDLNPPLLIWRRKERPTKLEQTPRRHLSAEASMKDLRMVWGAGAGGFNVHSVYGMQDRFGDVWRWISERATVPDSANQHLSELQIRPTSNSSKSTTTTQKLKSFCKRLYLMVV